MKEFKSFPFKMSRVAESGEFTGYASTFGEIDLGGDVVDPGAFKKTLRESRGKVPVLDHHDPTRQIGWNLEAREDDRGLLVRGLLDLNVRAARERHSLMKMAVQVGGRTGLSIGFRTVKEGPDRQNPLVRHLKEVQLFEYSIVTFPMNTQAGITTIKAKQDLIEQFLQREIGLEKGRTAKALTYIRSLLHPEPGYHSDVPGADVAGPSADTMESILDSMNKLLTTIRLS
ncbi:MAG: HK97 family phage prohead protease [Nitrospinaceae bacterium]